MTWVKHTHTERPVTHTERPVTHKLKLGNAPLRVQNTNVQTFYTHTHTQCYKKKLRTTVTDKVYTMLWAATITKITP